MNLPPESHRLDPTHHPTPFSAAQIRDASRPGTTVTYRVESAEGDTYLDRWEFLGGDEQRGRRRRWAETPDGQLVEEVQEFESAWLDLQRHASYPASTTRLTTGTAITGAGEFDCWIYVMANDDGTITAASFAPTEPGPPVLMESRRDGEVVFRMELLAVERAD
jgi:hypothetical protein